MAGSTPYVTGGYGSNLPGYTWLGGGMFWFKPGGGEAAPPVENTGAAVAPAVMEGMAAAMGGAISNTKIPISWGDRRIYGKVVDHIVKALDPATGIGAETLCISAGEPVFKDVPNDLYKILSGSTVLYNDTQGGIVHPAVASVTWYDGTSDDQPQDPLFVAKFGADVVPGYVGQMIAVIDFNTYQPWSGARPEPFTIFIQDASGLGKYRPWGGALDPGHKDPDMILTDGNMTFTVTHEDPVPAESKPLYGGVRGTVGHSSGRRYFEFTINAWGGYVSLYQISILAVGFIGPQEVDYNKVALGQQEYTSLGMHIHVDWGSKTLTAGFFSMSGMLDLVVGVRYGVAVDLDKRLWWITNNGVDWYGKSGSAMDVTQGPLEGENGQTNIQELVGIDTLYLAGSGYQTGDSVSFFTTLDQFIYPVPDGTGTTSGAGLRNWGEVFVELAKISNLDPSHVIVQDITAASEGGIIYDGFAWSDVVSNAGKMENIDWWEDGRDIYIRQTANDNPATDVASIPTSHRYIIDDNAGATDAQRGGERRKPVVYSVGYYDVSRQFQESFMMARSEAFESAREEKLSTPFVMTATAAATRSAIALGKSEMEFEEHHHELPPMVPYIRMRPADIVEFTEEGKAFKTKVSNWTLETDWTIKTSYRKLFTTATNPIVPFQSEIIDASMPAYLVGQLIFSEDDNSGYLSLLEDI